MTKQQSDNARFFLWYGLIEGSFIILAVLAWAFWHHNMAYLIGSIVIIALVGSTFLMPRVLMTARAAEDDDPQG